MVVNQSLEGGDLSSLLESSSHLYPSVYLGGRKRSLLGLQQKEERLYVNPLSLLSFVRREVDVDRFLSHLCSAQEFIDILRNPFSLPHVSLGN